MIIISWAYLTEIFSHISDAGTSKKAGSTYHHVKNFILLQVNIIYDNFLFDRERGNSISHLFFSAL